MPFVRDDADGSAGEGSDAPLDELRIAQRPADGYRFDLLAGFAYVDPVSGARYRVPGAGERMALRDTDLASVPSALWSFIASYGRQSAPALLHDHRSLVAAELARTDRPAALRQRREDDRVFRTALREQRVPLVRAWLMWGWVSADREREFAGVRGWLFILQAVLGALVVVAALVAVWWHPAWLLVALVPAVAAIPWWRLAPLQLLLAYGSGLLAPLVVLQLAALVPFRIVEAAVELVTGGDAREVVRPTVAPGGSDPARDASGRDQGQP